MKKAKGKAAAQEAIVRQWMMLRQIPRSPRSITATDLQSLLSAGGYEVAKRTVERDLQTLSGYFPIVCEESTKPFLWSWERNAPNLNLPGLSSTEALLFHLAEKHLGTLIPASTLRALTPYFNLAKKTLDHSSKESAWANRIRIVPSTQPLLPAPIRPGVYSAITQSLLEQRKLKATYRRRDSKSAMYELNPLALIQRGHVSYLAATAFDFKDVRLYAMHRFSSCKCLEEAAARLDGFSVDTYIEQGGLGFGKRGEQIEIEALFDVETAVHLEETALAVHQTLTPTKDGRVRLKAKVIDTPQLRWWLLGFGENVEVTQPEALREAMATCARAMMARYT